MTHKMHPDTIDIESSGIGSDSYPIEIGVVLASGSRYCSLITPPGDWTHWSPHREKLHGITREILMSKGKPIAVVCEDLNAFIGGKTVFSDNGDADKRWLKKLFIKANVQPSFQLYDIDRLLINRQKEYWDKARANVNQKFPLARHRASNEAFLIQQTYIESRRLSLEGE